MPIYTRLSCTKNQSALALGILQRTDRPPAVRQGILTLKGRRQGEGCVHRAGCALLCKQEEHRKRLLTVAVLAVGILLVFLGDAIHWMGVFMVCLPMLSLFVGIYLTGLSIYRSGKKQTYRGLRIDGIIAIGIPILKLLILCIGVICGAGPVPS